MGGEAVEAVVAAVAVAETAAAVVVVVVVVVVEVVVVAAVAVAAAAVAVAVAVLVLLVVSSSTTLVFSLDTNLDKLLPFAKNVNGNWGRNAHRNYFWGRYWGSAGQLLANFARVTIPEVFAKVNSAQFPSFPFLPKVADWRKARH